MRAVLDTNILARPAHDPSGPAAEVVQRLSQDPHVLLISDSILTELHRVLRYERVRRLHGFTDEEINEYVASIEAVSVFVELPAVPPHRVVPGDPDDDYVIATAEFGKADAICTRNKHFHPQPVRDYCRQHSIQIVDDLELLELLRTEEQIEDMLNQPEG